MTARSGQTARRTAALGSTLLAAILALAGAGWWSGGGAAAARLVAAETPSVGPVALAVVGSVPAANARVGTAPRNVELQFNRPVARPTVHVLGPNGERVDLDGTLVVNPPATSASVTIQAGRTGGYLVTWSAHPAGASGSGAGALAFAVGRVPSWSNSGAAQYLSAGGAGPALAAAVNGAEAVALAALLVLAGLILAVGRGWVRRGRRSYSALTGLLVLVGAGSAAGLVLHGPFAAGLPAGEALSRAMARATLHTSWGVGALLALAGVVVLGLAGGPFVLGHSGRTSVTTAAMGGTVLLGAGAVASGHALSGPLPGLWTALVALHVVSAMVLAAVLVARVSGDRRPEGPRLGAVADSRVLRGSVIAVAVSGLMLAVHETGVLSAVTGTAYGRVVLAKALTTGALLAAAWAVSDGSRPRRLAIPAAAPEPGRKASRSAGRRTFEPAVKRRREPPAPHPAPAPAPEPPTGAAPSGRGDGGAIQPLGVAAVLFVVASLMTAVLMFQTPGRIAAPRPATGTLIATGMDMEYQLTPARVGQNNLHLYILSSDGSPLAVPGASADLTWATAAGEPLPVGLSDAGPGHFLDYGLEIPLAGSWTLHVTVGGAGGQPGRTFSAPVTIHP